MKKMEHAASPKVELEAGHYEWLLLRIDELEEENKELEKQYDEQLEVSQETYDYFKSEIERYKQALEEILEEAYEEAGIHPDTGMQLETFIVKTARQALEGEE